jgi:FkbH-like protein
MRFEFNDAFRKILPNEPGVVVIHSSLPDLLPPSSFSLWDVASIIRDLTKEGYTIALPSFTFSFCRGEKFSITKTPSETGILAEFILNNFTGAIRTQHPIYSFVCLGPESERFSFSSFESSFGLGSVFEVFEDMNATFVMMGCSWKFNTFFHRFEELSNVPYRFIKQFCGDIDFGNGWKNCCVKMFVRNLEIDAINDFSEVIRQLKANELIKSVNLWNGFIESANSKDIADVCKTLLKSDPYSLVENARIVEKHLSWKSEAASHPPLKISVFGSQNTYLMEKEWLNMLFQLLPERYVEISSYPFGQMRQAIWGTGENKEPIKSTIRVFVERLEDILGKNLTNLDQEVEMVRAYGELIALYHQKMGGWTLVHKFFGDYQGLDSLSASKEATRVANLNAILEKTLDEITQLAWIDVEAEAAQFSGSFYDSRLWLIGRFPFSEEFSNYLAKSWTGLTLSFLGKSIRLIVTDLDNTLWGGILGEDGIDRLQVGSDFPGNAYLDYQKALKKLVGRGIALAICSKNDEDLALQAIDSLPEMQLRSEDFATHRINWKPKWENLIDIANELNLGLESILFIDDNPVEREAIKKNLPGVKVLDIPLDPARYSQTLFSSPFTKAASLSPEDLSRVKSYSQRKLRILQLSKAASPESYLKSLNITLYLNPLTSSNMQRAVQLCQKTNQFNTTTKRYDEATFRAIINQGGEIIVVGLEDNLSPYENIGLLVLLPNGDGDGIIDLYLLSCRVLGRGIETMIPIWAAKRAFKRGWTSLFGVVIETERNVPVRQVFKDAGFYKEDENTWKIDTKSIHQFPDWIALKDGFI